jgi:hypothetical protein
MNQGYGGKENSPIIDNYACLGNQNLFGNNQQQQKVFSKAPNLSNYE